MADRIIGFQKADNNIGRFPHHPAGGSAVDIEQLLVGDKARRPDTENRAPVRQMIEKRDALGHLIRMMKR